MIQTAERSAVLKIRLRVLFPIMTLIVLSSLDRVNISFAALQMNAAIGLTPELYGFAVGIFFLGYLLFQFPSTSILTRVGARRWIAGCVVLWGCVATSMTFVHTPESLYAARFLLGAAESGFAPGVVYYCSGWMPKRYRAGAIAITLLAVPVSVMIGGPLCGWLLSADNPLDIAGWRWMFLMEGLATVLMGVAAYFWFVDSPADARWLTAAERKWVEDELARENGAAVAVTTHGSSAPSAIRVALADSRAWFAAGVWCTTLVGANGMIFWLPQAIKQMSAQSDFAVGVLSALPWAGVGLGMIVNAWHSDRAQERFLHTGVPLAIAGVALIMASVVEPGPLALVCLFLSGIGLGSAQGVFWSIPTGFLHRAIAAGGITLINLVGNVGSLAGPYTIGWIRAHSESFAAPVWFVSAVMILGAGLLLPLHARHRYNEPLAAR